MNYLPWFVFLCALPAGAAVFEVTCDESARHYGWCSSEQDGKVMTVFSVAVEGKAEAQCPHEKANDPECQSARLVKALTPNWQSSVICSQSLVDAGICHRTYLGKKVGNPIGIVKSADREHRAALWGLVAAEWKKEAEALIGPPPPMLLDGKEAP